MLYRPPDIDEQPSVKLADWQAYRIAEGNTVHFVGRLIGEKGRVSSPVVSFDPETMTGVTRSGRRYELVGPPGRDEDADYVWGYWCAYNGVKSFSRVAPDALAEAFADLPSGLARPQ